MGVAVVMCLGSLGHLLMVDLSGVDAIQRVTGWESNNLLWVVLGSTTSVVAAGLWSLFAFRYAGRAQSVDRLATAGVAVLSAASLTVAVRAVMDGPSVALVNALAVGYLLVGFLATVGIFLLLWASVGANAFPVREPLLLSAGIVVLLSGVHVAQVFDRPVLYPAALLLAGLSFAVPVWKYPLFETLPAARVAGRDRVVNEMDDGVLVADRTGVLRDLNPAAASLFDVSRDDAIGRPLQTLFDSGVRLEAIIESQDPVLVETHDGVLEVSGTAVTDQRDRSFGTLLVCTDVTERWIREEQLTLLTQFVGDVVHEHMADVAADVDAFEDNTEPDATDRATTAQRVWERTTDLTTLVAHARDIEQAIAPEDDRLMTAADLRPRIRDVTEQVAAEHSVELTLETPSSPFSVPISPDLFGTVLSILLEDACERAGDTVALEVTFGPPTVRIRSDGPMSSQNSATDEEMSLSVTRLVVDQVGGSVSVTRDEDQRQVTLRFPDPDAGNEQTAGDYV
jgi:PAS domain-containing protein